jgi:hypothetical protein
MTKRKSDLRPQHRVPEFVNRETGAGELCISPETWDDWVERDILPPKVSGFPASSPRWCWEDVRNRLRGIVPDSGRSIIAAAERMKHGTQARGTH